MTLRVLSDTLTPAAYKWRSASRSLRNIIKKIMLAGALKVSNESKRRAPTDLGNLEAAHDTKLIIDNRRRIKVEVNVGGTVNGVDVDDYAIHMHEGRDYKLGPLSQMKQASDPTVVVGPKFLEEGLRVSEDEIVQAIEDALFGAIK